MMVYKNLFYNKILKSTKITKLRNKFLRIKNKSLLKKRTRFIV